MKTKFPTGDSVPNARDANSRIRVGGRHGPSTAARKSVSLVANAVCISTSVTKPAARQSETSKCVIKPGIGLCDLCSLPKWPQQYVGYGTMICLDCLS